MQRIAENGTSAPQYKYDAFGNQKESCITDPNSFRYCGEYFDSETGELYLRARYYDSSTGRFSQEDIARDNFNWYLYCSCNPIRFIDENGLYDREAAVKYALEYAENPNPEYLAFDMVRDKIRYLWMYQVKLGDDCTNFTSQALAAGGIEMSEDWHFYQTDNELFRISDGPLIPNWYTNPDGELTTRAYEYDFTPEWSFASDQFAYFSNPENGYINGEVLSMATMEEMYDIVQNGGIQIGDLLYFENAENGIHHSVMITGFKDDGGILYSARSSVATNKAISINTFMTETLYIIRIRDTPARSSGGSSRGSVKHEVK